MAFSNYFFCLNYFHTLYCRYILRSEISILSHNDLKILHLLKVILTFHCQIHNLLIICLWSSRFCHRLSSVTFFSPTAGLQYWPLSRGSSEGMSGQRQKRWSTTAIRETNRPANPIAVPKNFIRKKSMPSTFTSFSLQYALRWNPKYDFLVRQIRSP